RRHTRFSRDWSSDVCSSDLRELGRDLTLVGVGLAIVSTTSVEADVEWGRFFAIGTALTLALVVPYAIDRWVFRRTAYTFPWRTRSEERRVRKEGRPRRALQP